jgi:hypothetical protein
MPTVFDERFVDGRSGWPNEPGGTAWISNSETLGGSYELRVRDAGGFTVIEAPLAATFRDAVVTARFRKVVGPPGSSYGIIVRSTGIAAVGGIKDSSRYYLFEASDLGEYEVLRRDDDRWTSLVPRSISPHIRPGTGDNELVALVIGEQLSFRVNGVEVASVRDSQLKEGGAGVFVGGEANHSSVQHFTIEAPELRLRGTD